jgi:hypothetical protein
LYRGRFSAGYITNTSGFDFRQGQGLNRAKSATRRQKAFNAGLALDGPSAVNPPASTTAFIAPADVPGDAFWELQSAKLVEWA